MSVCVWLAVSIGYGARYMSFKGEVHTLKSAYTTTAYMKYKTLYKS